MLSNRIPEETEQAKKGWWGSCTCFRMEKASSVACTMKYELVPYVKMIHAINTKCLPPLSVLGPLTQDQRTRCTIYWMFTLGLWYEQLCCSLCSYSSL